MKAMMRAMMRARLSLALLSFAAFAVHAGDKPGSTATAVPQARNFIACPIYRDTDAGRKSGCWLATELSSGVQYDVTDALIKPILGKEILVEGVVSENDPGSCGAPILEPVFVSILQSECKPHLIPAEGFPGRRFALPARTLQPARVPRPVPPPPYDSREYTVYFELDSDFLLYQHSEIIIDDAVTYIRASKPRRIAITGYADTRGFEASGRHLQENIDIATARANMLLEALLRLGVAKSIISTESRGDPQPDVRAQEGLVHSSKRRGTIRVEM